MEALSAQDAAFLFVENECNHMQIAAVAIFDGPAPEPEALNAMIESKLDRLPRYRQRLQRFPFDVAQPCWIDDVDFDLTYHVRRTALASPGGSTELQNLLARVMSQKLDRNRPLWELWSVEGLEGGQWAILSKVHHCLADGVSGSALLATLLDATPSPKPPEPSAWAPEAEPSNLALALRSATDGLRAPLDGLRGLRRVAARPRRALEELGHFTDGLQSFRSSASGRSAPSLNGPIGPYRRWHTFARTLGDLKTIQADHAGSINDIVLAAVAGGFGRLLSERGESIDGMTIRSLVPVSTHHADEDGTSGNQVTAMFVDLPLAASSSARRLAEIHDQTTHLKRHHQADAAEMLSAMAGLAPPALLSFGASRLPDADQALVQTVTTNVRGPTIPLYALGRRLRSVRPYVPLFGTVRIAIAVFSYAGEIAFGLTGDYESAPDLDVLAAGIDAEIDALLGSAGARVRASG